MNRWQALQDFWGSFGIPAYVESKVPTGAKKPYITYEASVGRFERLLPVSASIWDKTDKGSEFVDTKADEIEAYIETMGCPEIDGGRYRVYISDTQFAQTGSDPDDKEIKRVILNVTFEFMI